MLLIAGPAAIILDVILLIIGADPMEIVVWVDTYATYGYMLAYALVAIAGIIYTRRNNMKNGLVWITAIISVASMAYVFFANVWPVPPFPLNILPYLFILTLALAFLRYAYLKKNQPEVIQAIGNVETDTLQGI